MADCLSVEAVTEVIMHLTQTLSRYTLVAAVTGLYNGVLVCLFSVVVCALTSGTHNPCFIRSHEIAKSEPMRMIENVIIGHSAMDVDCLTAARDRVVFILSQRAYEFSKNLASIRVYLAAHRENRTVVDFDIGKYYAARHCDLCVPFKSRLLPLQTRLNEDSGVRISGWGLAEIFDTYSHGEGLAHGEFADAFYRAETDPSPLIYPHLRLDGVRTVLSRFRLLSSYRQLAVNFSSRFDGIRRSLLGLGVKDFRLSLHFLELAMENLGGVDAYSKQKKGDPYHVPSRVLEPWIGTLWICIGLVLDFVAMWLLWIRSNASKNGWEWFACVALAFLILAISLFPITHGTDLLGI